MCVCVRICYRSELNENVMGMTPATTTSTSWDQFNGNSCISYSSKNYLYINRLFWFRINSNEINKDSSGIPWNSRWLTAWLPPTFGTRFIALTTTRTSKDVFLLKNKNFWPRVSGEFVWAIVATTAVAIVIHFRYSEFVGLHQLAFMMTLLTATGLLTGPAGRQAGRRTSVVSTQTYDVR